MVTHGIGDIREFYNGDVRFSEQFPHFGDQGMTAFLEGRKVERWVEERGGGEGKVKEEGEKKGKKEPAKVRSHGHVKLEMRNP